jgi:hypothetical protein
MGYDIVRCSNALSAFPPDFDQSVVDLCRSIAPFTFTTPERIYALTNAVKYVVTNDIPGVIVECGVWRGGSMMTVARTLLQLGDTSRHLYLFDTYEGMTPPTEKDVMFDGRRASDLLSNLTKEDKLWAVCSLEEVQANLYSTAYPREKIHFVKGRVESTIPSEVPDTISLLRLDTDWYESTKHELVHLYPRLSKGGVIIIDDYGHVQGCREATEEFIRENNIRLLLNRIDYTGRIGIRT